MPSGFGADSGHERVASFATRLFLASLRIFRYYIKDNHGRSIGMEQLKRYEEIDWVREEPGKSQRAEPFPVRAGTGIHLSA